LYNRQEEDNSELFEKADHSEKHNRGATNGRKGRRQN
jgi:hypothetical protein